jgi:hypothetical protein
MDRIEHSCFLQAGTVNLQSLSLSRMLTVHSHTLCTSRQPMAQQQQQQLTQIQMQPVLLTAALLLTQQAVAAWMRLQWQQRERGCKHGRAKAAAAESAAVKQALAQKQQEQPLRRRGESLRALSLQTF